MTMQMTAKWHKQSYDLFLRERLSALLAERIPLAGYGVEPRGPYECAVTVTIDGGIVLRYEHVPCPDDAGVFLVGGVKRVVIPIASNENLETAEIRCAGEQMYDFIAERLGQAPPHLKWDEALGKAWLPLEAWIREFLSTQSVLDERNWLSRTSHLRRISIPSRQNVFAPGQIGRACPFETPEGPNIGKLLHVALGAEIRDGKLVTVDDRPETWIGAAAAMVPFIAHDDPNRALMGVNMMRQWIVPPVEDPAIVRTGNEPVAAGFWCGRNLLTAFVSWGGDTYEDAIVVSESAARRLGYPRALEAGDKLSNRHGTKGTISRIVPDEEMPHMPDGTPVELIFSASGLHTRMNFGQEREALMGRIAHAEATPAVVPPFAPPTAEQLKERLRAAGLDESGMVTLRDGRGGPAMRRPSLAGWVYWGKTYHLAAEYLRVTPAAEGGETPQWAGQGQSGLEWYALRGAGAMENLHEAFNTRSADRADTTTLAGRLAKGPVEQAGPPSPAFADVARRLAAGRIRLELRGGRLSVWAAVPEGQAIELARSVDNPWMRGSRVERVGAMPEVTGYGQLVGANERLRQLLAGGAPEALVGRALTELRAAVDAYFAGLMPAGDGNPMRPDNRVQFSGRAVISPGPSLRYDQVGIPDEIAWGLFGPLVRRELGLGEGQPIGRSSQAVQALDAVMSRNCVLVHRAPVIMPAGLLAMRPQRVAGRAIRLPAISLMLLNADFDGDQVSILLPVTAAAQAEAGEKLSIEGHLKRDAELVKWITPALDPMWALIDLSRREGGLRQLAELVGFEIAAPDGFITRKAVEEALRAVLARDGARAALESAQRLMDRGFGELRRSGLSMSPFFGEGVTCPEPPASGDWRTHTELVAEQLASRTDYDNPHLGPQLLAVKSGARGNLRQLCVMICCRAIADAEGRPRIIARGMRHGYSARDMHDTCVGARKGLGQVAIDFTRAAYGVREVGAPQGFGLLARAMRSEHPALVFANAALTGESDPLTDADSRAFVGMR